MLKSLRIGSTALASAAFLASLSPAQAAGLLGNTTTQLNTVGITIANAPLIGTTGTPAISIGALSTSTAPGKTATLSVINQTDRTNAAVSTDSLLPPNGRPTSVLDNDGIMNVRTGGQDVIDGGPTPQLGVNAQTQMPVDGTKQTVTLPAIALPTPVAVPGS